MKVQPMTRVAFAAVLLLVLTVGCASVTQDPPAQPQVVETPAAAPPAATPVALATPKPAPAAVPAPSESTPPAPAAAPAPSGTTPALPVPAVVAAPVARVPTPAAPPVVAQPSPVAPQALDLKTLSEQLRATKAIGVFTKLSLKNKVDDLLRQFRDHYDGKAKPTMAELRQFYNLLMMKVLSLLQDDDQRLASAIVASREAIWGLLSNPTTFATLQT